MPVEGELLPRVCAEPSNEEVRLASADRLLERGTFIAPPCELSRLWVSDERDASLLASTRRWEATHLAASLSGASERAEVDPPPTRVGSSARSSRGASFIRPPSLRR